MDLERIVRRLERWIVVLSALGAGGAFLRGGWQAAAGFALGAVAGYMSFRSMRKLVEALGQAQTKPPRARTAVLLGLRYALLGVAGYVILRYSSLSVTAALAGLFVPVAAVMLEILFELTYGTS
ncbi:MAG: ATP synthase subunit I [Bryobacteraceae bacterium]